MTPERTSALLKMGDYLDGIDEVQEYNYQGFNKADKSRWQQSRGHYGAMHGVLVKYHRQLEAVFGPLYTEAGLTDRLTDQDAEAAQQVRAEKALALKAERDRAARNISVAPTLVGSKIYFKVEGRISRADWDRYKEIQRGWGLRWDGVAMAWAVPPADLGRFRHDSYCAAMAEIGITVGPMPEVTAEVARATQVSRAYELSIVRDHDGRFVIRFPYHADMVALFSNRSGQLTGITEYDPTTRSRSTFSLELIEEIIEKVTIRFPDWGIEAPGVDEARRERDQRAEMLRRPIPGVAEQLAPGFNLFPYQNEMVHFIDRCGGNVLCGDSVGLGKTLQSLAWAVLRGRRVLVVCPKVVRRTWIDEARKFFPGYFAQGLELRLKMLKRGIPDLQGFAIVSVNYESLVKFEPAILAGRFDLLVIDESHRVKNPDAVVTKNVTRLAATIPHRLLLSGTAIKNKKVELHSQIELIDPGLLGTRRQLQTATIGGVWHTLRSRYLARQKLDVLKDLPSLQTSIARIEVEGLPDLGDDDALSGDFDIGQISRIKNAIALGKVPATVAFIQTLLDGGDDKILVFSDSLGATREIARALGDQALLHHGQMSDDNRELVKATFQRPGGPRVFCTTRQALAVGATLTAACLVVFNDLPWTPADVQQAEGRAHRVGQTKPVNSYWLTAQDNLFDERVTEILKIKFDLAKRVLEGKQVTPEERRWMERPISIAEIIKKRR